MSIESYVSIGCANNEGGKTFTFWKRLDVAITFLLRENLGIPSLVNHI